MHLAHAFQQGTALMWAVASGSLASAESLMAGFGANSTPWFLVGNGEIILFKGIHYIYIYMYIYVYMSI